MCAGAGSWGPLVCQESSCSSWIMWESMGSGAAQVGWTAYREPQLVAVYQSMLKYFGILLTGMAILGVITELKVIIPNIFFIYI